MSEQIRYGEWSKDRTGWFLGLSGVAWIALAATGLPGLVAMSGHRWGLLMVWLPIWLVLIVLIVVPVRGRPAARWAADSIMRAAGGVMGWTMWQSRAATGVVKDPGEVDLPGVLAGLRVYDGPPYGPLLSRPAIIANSAERTWAMVARITHPGIGLAEAGVRARMGAGLAELLEGAATAEMVATLAIQVRTVPEDGAERAAWTAHNLRSDAPAMALQVTNELSEAMISTGIRHEVFLTVVVPEARIAKQAKDAGGGVAGRARVLYGVMSEIGAAVTGPVGCSTLIWLDSPALAAAIRTGFTPGDRAGLTTAALGAAADPDAAALPVAAAGPSAAPPPEIRHYNHDSYASVTCTVLLPDKGAIMGALAPVFTPTEAGERRSVTVFFEPLGRHKADRIVGRDSLSAGTAAEMRARMGFQTRAAHRRAAARVAGQDVRLADGKALVRVAVAAAVTVPDSWAIADYGRRLEASIRGSGFAPLRLDLAQDSGFAAACIPVGIGLPRRRGLQ